ncbi:MAG: aminotransferase class III-fold pyridoxal phosphate-dependent enzyme [Clostridiaceae bacterium]|nr:aminotransferase class III-fold pyridoxal phosphate-dependent enzyme [Clostridiaceae bacterium]
MKSHGVLICGGSKEETMNKAVLLEDICKRNIKGNYDLAQNTTSDKTVELLSVVKEKFKYAALVQTPAVNACANKGIPIYAQLDDMAQMIGRKIPVVSDNDVVRYIDEVRPNDLNMLEKMLKKNRLKGGTAAVILEPVGPESGTRPISKEYNMEVRKLCDKYGALLIFDEVVTGFRVGLGGAQGYFNVVPDLTIFGKIIAGGYPGAGGVGGKKEYAQLMAAGLATGKHRAYVGGTLAANPLSCLAGYTAIREIERTNACEIAGAMGDRLCDGLKELIDRYGLPYVAYNQGSIVHLECTGAMSFDFSSMSFIKSAIGILKHKNMMYERKDSMERMGAAYMANGIVTLAGSRLYTSLADTPEIIDEALNRFEEVFKHVKKTDKGKV